MTYKLLVNGSNLSMVKEFLGLMENSFDCLSTTDGFGDLCKHCRLFEPNAILFFVDRLYSGLVDTLHQFKSDRRYNSIPVIFITKEEVIRELEIQGDKGLVDFTLYRPISSDNIILRTMGYLDKAIGSAEDVMPQFAEDTAVYEEAMPAAPVQPVPEAPKAPAAPTPAPAPAAPAKQEQPAASGPAKKQILVVDDDRNVLKMLKTALEEKYEVTSTLNGLIVEKVLATKKIDLIVLDYEMPIMTGAEVYRKIKAKPEYANIPICFLTGVSDKEKVMEIMSLRPDSYLLKPLDLEVLMTAIENLI